MNDYTHLIASTDETGLHAFWIAPPVAEGQAHVFRGFVGDHDASDRFCRTR